MIDYAKDILNRLVDKFERSKAFLGRNQINRPPMCKITQQYPEYADDSNYEVFADINQAVAQLEEQGFITVKRRSGTHVVEKVSLVVQTIPVAYEFLNRQPKNQRNQEIGRLLHKYGQTNKVLTAFCQEQLARLEQNKEVSYAADLSTFEQILKVMAHIFEVEEETYRRDFSVRVLGDSKAFEKIESKVVNLLYTYGDFAEKDTILAELNVVRNPGHVYCKGDAILTLCGGQTLDLAKLHGDFGISSDSLRDVERVDVRANRVVTIENLTTFHSFHEPDSFAIYLGGYHNQHRREFILRVFEHNKDKNYYHYGDIDAGGFLIWQHLCDKTGIPFQPLHMDIESLERCRDYTKPLTQHDRTRLQTLHNPQIIEVIDYMLEHNCKLEQEALD